MGLDGLPGHKVPTPMGLAAWRRIRSVVVAACLAGPGAAWADPAGASQVVVPSDLSPPQLLNHAEVAYPAEAPPDLHADVVLIVTVDAAGAVTEAVFESGPPVFAEAAVAAATSLRFAPAVYQGTPVGSRTRVTFHVAPPAPEVPEEAYEIVVHDVSLTAEPMVQQVRLDEAALERSAGDDLATTAAQVPGVVASAGSAATSKPILRGMSQRRQVLRVQGIRHEAQKWGPDHAPEVDPFSAGSITVVRGAAAVRYGPDAIAGALLVDPPAFRREEGVGGKLRLGLATNGWRPSFAARVDLVPLTDDRFTVRVEGSGHKGASLVSPTGVLGNTASEQANLGLAAEARLDRVTLRATLHHHHSRMGIYYGLQASTRSDFEAAVAGQRPAGSENWTVDYGIDRPKQTVDHDRAVFEALVELGKGWSLDGRYAFQHDARREFEAARPDVSGPQYDFKLATHTAQVAVESPAHRLGSAATVGTYGAVLRTRQNVYQGYDLLPHERGATAGVFAVQRVGWDRGDVELGARYDHQGRRFFLDDESIERLARESGFEVTDCTALTERVRCGRSEDTGSVSLGGLWHVVPDVFDWTLELSSASRFPDTDELYLVGPAPSMPVYGVGDPTLGTETSWGGSTTGGLRLDWLQAELTGHARFVHNYVLFAPSLSDSGQAQYEVTVRGAWPRYSQSAIDAWVMGTDAWIRLFPDGVVGLDLTGSLVRIWEAGSSTNVVGTPPDRAQARLIGRLPPLGAVETTELEASLGLVDRQRRTDPAADLAPPPEGYALVGLRATSTIHLHPVDLTVGLEVRNLLNTTYRDYNSLLRYYADAPGRDVRLRFSVDF